MRVLVTGAGGFLGRRLSRALVAAGSLAGSDGRRRPIAELCLADLAAFEPPPAPGLAIETCLGDLAEPAFLESLIERGFDSLFHLASQLTLQAERDPARAYIVNVEALRHLLDGAQHCPTVVFASSIAVFGGELPETVGDEVAPAPTTTYGIHKAIDELLIAEYSRQGWVDGRSLRLPIVLTRPGTPQPAVSDRLAGILREPFAGIDVSAPLAAGTAVPVASAGAVVAALLRVHDLPAHELPARRAFNLPGLTVTVAELAEAAARRGATGKVTYAPDPQMQAIVDGWPSRFVSDRAARLGIAADPDVDALVSDYLDHRED